MDNSIGDILNGEPTEETPVVEEVVETPEVAEEAEPVTAERPRGPDGKFIPKETGVEPEATQEAVPPTTDRLPQAEYAALRDERQKRQQLEARLAELETHIQSQRQPQAPESPPPDMFDDPDGFKAHMRDQILQELQPVLQRQATVSRAEMLEIQARQVHADYDEVVDVFKEGLAANPFMMNELLAAHDPVAYAYNAGKQIQQARAYGNAPTSEADIEARMREKIIAELDLNRPKAPSTFAGDRSVGSRSGPAWTGPTPMGDLLR